jgi:hypothetical protein
MVLDLREAAAGFLARTDWERDLGRGHRLGEWDVVTALHGAGLPVQRAQNRGNFSRFA